MNDSLKLKEAVAIQRFISIHKDNKLFEKVDIYEFLEFVITNKEDINFLTNIGMV